MLFAEMLRKCSKEEVLYEEATGWSGVENHDWTTRFTKTINLSEEKIVYVTFDFTYSGGTACSARCLIDDVPFISSGPLFNGKRDGYVVLAAGSYTFKFQTMDPVNAGVGLTIDNIKIAALKFDDVDKASYDNGNVAAGNNATTTILSTQTVPASAARKTCVGPIKKYTALIACYMQGNERKSIPKSPGEGNESGKLSWKIYIDGTQTAWDDRKEDYGNYTAQNPTWGEGCYGLLAIPVDAGSTWQLRIDVYNNTGGSKTCRAYVKIVLCPWIIPNEEYEPVTLDFAQGATLYVVLEPLEENPTKDVKIGKVRFVSFGDATDFYSKGTGTGILSHSYTFEAVEIEEALMLISGFGGCISILAVDER